MFPFCCLLCFQLVLTSLIDWKKQCCLPMFLLNFDAPVAPLAHNFVVVLVEISDEVESVLAEIVAKSLCHHVNLCRLTLIPNVNLDVVVAQVQNPQLLCLHLELHEHKCQTSLTILLSGSLAGFLLQW